MTGMEQNSPIIDLYILTILFNPCALVIYMSDKRRQNNKKRARKPNPGKREVNEYPRQGDQDPELGLVGEKGIEEVAENKGEALGKDIKKRMRKGQDEGVTFDPSRSEE